LNNRQFGFDFNGGFIMHTLIWILFFLFASGSTASKDDAKEKSLPPIFVITTEGGETFDFDDDGGYSTSTTTTSGAPSPNTDLDKDSSMEDVEELDYTGLAVWVFNKSAVDFDPKIADYFTINTISITSHKDMQDLVGILKTYGRHRSNSQGKGSPFLSYGIFSPSKDGSR
jgi:hypothetical protein